VARSRSRRRVAQHRLSSPTIPDTLTSPVTAGLTFGTPNTIDRRDRRALSAGLRQFGGLYGHSRRMITGRYQPA
jgi:hypothetical protein